MRIMPQSVNQSPQLNNRRNNVNFGMKISDAFGSTLISQITDGLPGIASESNRAMHNQILTHLRSLFSAMDLHQSLNPGSNLILERIVGKTMGDRTNLKPELLNGTPDQMNAFGFSVDPTKDGRDFYTAFTKKLDEVNGISTAKGPGITAQNYKEEAKKVIGTIIDLMQNS